MTDYTEQIVDALSELMLRFPDMPAVVRNEFAEFIMCGTLCKNDRASYAVLERWCDTLPHGSVVETMFRVIMPNIPPRIGSWEIYIRDYSDHMKRYDQLTNS